MIEYSIQPWETWPRKETPSYNRKTPFKSTYQKTLDQLDTEMGHLKAKGVVLQLKVNRGDIRLDGRLRNDARTSHPGVILTFKRDGRTISMPCDACKTWQDNLRAIVHALEHLRGADRYGVTQSGEQYRGWEALPPPGAAKVMDRAAALDIIAQWSGIPQTNIEALARVRTFAIREARINVHPDKGGDNEAAAQVDEAARILEAEK